MESEGHPQDSNSVSRLSFQPSLPNSYPPPTSDPLLRLTPTTLFALAVTFLTIYFTMVTDMPGFLTRLLRPVTSAAKIGLGPEGAAGGTIPRLDPERAHKATVAAGCFWGTEHVYRDHFHGRGLFDARVGYIGGDIKSPNYRAVCTGKTGHAEALQIFYDPNKVTYAQLIEFFYRMHDPTTHNRQGNDAGTQYRSAIFYHDTEQKRIAEDITAKANEQWYHGKIKTEVVEAGSWWDAEKYHQLYLQNNPDGYQCPTHYLRDFPPLK